LSGFQNVLRIWLWLGTRFDINQSAFILETRKKKPEQSEKTSPNPSFIKNHQAGDHAWKSLCLAIASVVWASSSAVKKRNGAP